MQFNYHCREDDMQADVTGWKKVIFVIGNAAHLNRYHKSSTTVRPAPFNSLTSTETLPYHIAWHSICKDPDGYSYPLLVSLLDSREFPEQMEYAPSTRSRHQPSLPAPRGYNAEDTDERYSHSKRMTTRKISPEGSR